MSDCYKASIILMTGFLSACGGGASSAPQELFIGHSFFRPFAENMAPVKELAGMEAKDTEVVFSGGASGSPQALWEDASKRNKIQGFLDGGNVELFAMTYEPEYPSDEGYVNWIDYALSNNPDTKFVLALPWPDFPDDYATAQEYSDSWHTGHDGDWQDLLGSFRVSYPDNEFISVPYGQSALELRILQENDELSDVDVMISNTQDDSTDNDIGIFVDQKGHADEILVDLGTLVWGKFIYNIEPDTKFLSGTYQVDLPAIANDIADQHSQ